MGQTLGKEMGGEGPSRGTSPVAGPPLLRRILGRGGATGAAGAVVENDGKLDRFSRWFEAQGGRINWGAIRMVAKRTEDDDQHHYAVFAARDLEATDPPEWVCRIPKASCLTTVTTSIRDRIRESKVRGPLGLIVAVMHEMSLGAESKWHPYFDLIPARESSLPVFWDEDGLELLEGTSLEDKVAADRDLMLQDYRDVVKPFFTSVCDDDYEEDEEFDAALFGLFMSAASLVASRAFRVDDVHGDGMVPVADLFNHRTDRENVRIFGEGGLPCEACQNKSCEDAECQRTDAGNAKAGEESAASAEDDEGKDEDEAEAAALDQVSKFLHGALSDLEMFVVRGAREGEEVFNTFGTHGNAHLIHKYGFAETDNARTAVDVPEDIVNEVMGGQEEYEEALEVASMVYTDPTAGVRMAPDYEIDAEGEPSQDLMIVLSVSEDGKDPREAERVQLTRLLSVLKLRLDTYPPLEEEEDGGEEEREDHAGAEEDARVLAERHPPCIAGGGCTYAGPASAIALRVTEKGVLQKAFLATVDKLRALDGPKRTRKTKQKKGKTKRRKVVAGVPYDPIVAIQKA